MSFVAASKEDGGEGARALPTAQLNCDAFTRLPMMPLRVCVYRTSEWAGGALSAPDRRAVRQRGDHDRLPREQRVLADVDAPLAREPRPSAHEQSHPNISLS